MVYIAMPNLERIVYMMCASVYFIVFHGGLIAALQTSCYLLSLCFYFHAKF